MRNRKAKMMLPDRDVRELRLLRAWEDAAVDAGWTWSDRHDVLSDAKSADRKHMLRVLAANTVGDDTLAMLAMALADPMALSV
jgi:hypothetical protein